MSKEQTREPQEQEHSVYVGLVGFLPHQAAPLKLNMTNELRKMSRDELFRTALEQPSSQETKTTLTRLRELSKFPAHHLILNNQYDKQKDIRYLFVGPGFSPNV